MTPETMSYWLDRVESAGAGRTPAPMSEVDKRALEYLESYHAWLLARADYVDLVLVGRESAQVSEAVRRIREGSL